MSQKEPTGSYFHHPDVALCSIDTGPLAGLRHRTVIDGTTGARQLALWQEDHLPEFYVPPHRHDCEEIITILDGKIDAIVGDVVWQVPAGGSVLIPSWALHGFRVTSDVPVRLLAIFGSPTPGIFRADGTPTIPPWLGGASDHLNTNA